MEDSGASEAVDPASAAPSSTEAVVAHEAETPAAVPAQEPASAKKEQQQTTPTPPAQPNMGIPVQYNQQQYNGNAPGGIPSRNSSPMMRPGSVASTGSNASYLTANTVGTAATAAMPRYSNGGNTIVGYVRGPGQHPGHHHPQGPLPPPHGGPYQQHHPQAHGGVARPATGRYPLPTRGAPAGPGGHPLRPVPTRMGGGAAQNFAPQRHGGHHQPHYGGHPHQQEYHQHHHQMQYHHHQQHYQGPPQQYPQEAAYAEQGSSIPPPPPPPPPAEKPEDENQGQNNETSSVATATSKQESIKEEQPASTEERPEQAEQVATTPVPEQRMEMNQPGEEAVKMHPQEASPHPSSAPTNGPNMHYGGGYPREQQQHYQQPSYHHQQQYHQQHAHAGYGYSQQGHPQSMRYGGGYQYNDGPGGISPPPSHYQQQQQQQQYYQQQHHHQQYPHNEYGAGPSAAAHHGHYGMHPQETQQQYYSRHAGGMPPQGYHHQGGGFQLPHYNAANPGSRRGSFDASPATTAETRSPSPPPQPPAAANGVAPEQSNETNDGASIAEASTNAASVDTNKSKAVALGEREQNAAKSDGKPTKSPGKKEDATADAASILLQLGLQASKGDSENENPQGGKVPQSVQGSGSTDEESEMTHPDLTSEPSGDSTEQQQQQQMALSSRVVDSEFPCPIPPKYPTRLCLPYDGAKLNSLHCFLRSELLEIFVVKQSANKSPTHSPHSSVGRVGLRCVHCAMTRRNRDDRDEAPMAVFYPKSVAEIYRLVTSWQRCHLRKCRNLPPAVRAKWQELRETDKSRGKTHYWVTAAKEIGLRDCQSRAGGIRFEPDLDASKLPPQTRCVEYEMTPMDTAASNAGGLIKNHVHGDPPGERA